MPKNRKRGSPPSHVSITSTKPSPKPPKTKKKYRVSGHEGFACRYAWLPKVVKALNTNSGLFANEENAMVVLGVGKNMVRSMRFWSQAFGIADTAKGSSYSLTDFGRLVLGSEGLDPYLEDPRTLWLLHWNLTANVNSPLLAWDYLFNRWQEPELHPEKTTRALAREAELSGLEISTATLEQHFQAFIHTYVATRGSKADFQEESLDSPFVELELILRAGQREFSDGAEKREPIYVFRRERKPEITPELFAYCLGDFWKSRHNSEQTLPLSEIANGHGSPGQIFKLPEEDIRERAGNLEAQTDSFSYIDSSLLQQIKRRDFNLPRLLSRIYATELVHA
ncbi:MAG: DUF4007 family protein [Terriglobales bacterium]